MKWDIRFLKLAKHVSNWSKDPSTKVGAVITAGKNTIVSLGYNGFPPGDPDLPEEYLDRPKKYTKIIHGEINAINFANFGAYNDMSFTLYTYPMQPCFVCSEIIVSTPIDRVVSIKPSKSILDRWYYSFKKSKENFDAAGIDLLLLDRKI